MDGDIKTENHITYDCHYHVVWCTKYKLDLLKDGADDRLKEIICDVAQEFNATVEKIEIMDDYVHLLLDCYQHAADKIIRAMKGRSSRILKNEYPFIKSRTPSLWTRRYFIATTGDVQLSVIKKYIENQKRR